MIYSFHYYTIDNEVTHKQLEELQKELKKEKKELQKMIDDLQQELEEVSVQSKTITELGMGLGVCV